MKEINLKIDTCEVRAKLRKIKAVWSYEAVDDLCFTHNISSSASLYDNIIWDLTINPCNEIPLYTPVYEQEDFILIEGIYD